MTAPDPSLQPHSIEPQDVHFILDRLLGFFELKALSIAVDHRLVSLLAEKPSTIAELAERAGIPTRGTTFLVVALAGMELLTCEEGRYRPTPFGEKYFVDSSPFYQGAYVKLFNWVFDALPKLPEGIREDRPVWEGPSHYLKNDASQGKIDLETTTRANQKLFNESVNASQILVAQSVFEHVDLSGHKRLLDVGGSYGRFVATAITRFPGLRGTTFDLPQVAPEATKQIAAWGLSDRMDAVGGDFLKDWPTGYDVISFIRVLNARTTEVCAQMLKKAYDLLPSGGRVVFMDAPVLSADPSKPGRLAARLNLMVVTHSRGDVRPLDQWIGLLRGAGFEAPDVSVFADPYGILSAKKK